MLNYAYVLRIVCFSQMNNTNQFSIVRVEFPMCFD